MNIVLCVLAVVVHISGLAFDTATRQLIIYARNQIFALCLLFCTVQILDFLAFHPLFGPWTIIISNLMFDLGRFLVILFIFLFGFSMHVAAIYQPVWQIFGNTTGDGFPPLGKYSIGLLYE